ncbi:MAG: zf-HC2 domain-containing protein [Oscillospiraceae bacterium]|nr:zf-HC2 domain-containing protein [Oscillospiraceae bacterium]
MIVTCKVIEDLLPLYADGICSEDTKTVVEHHTAECADCRKKLEAMTSNTVETEKNGEKKPSPENPFKKLRRHYTRLVVCTLLICAAVMIPSALLFKLYVGEETNQGMSFSSIAVSRELKKFGNMLKRGEYRKALDYVDLYYQDGYTPAEIAAFKEMFVADLEEYYKTFPIKKVKVEAADGKSDNGNVLLYLDAEKYKGMGKEPVQYIYFEFRKEDDGSRAMIFGGSDCWVDPDSDYDRELNATFPPLQLISKSQAEHVFDRLKTESGFYFTFWTFITDEKLSYADQMDEKRGTPKEEVINCVYAQKTIGLLEDYNYVGCKGGDITYVREDILDMHSYFIQHAVLTMSTSDGSEFTAEFDLPLIAFNNYTHLKNVSYSDNVPDDFRQRFEEIFVSDEPVYGKYTDPKLNEGKFYLNGNTESCYYEFSEGTVRIVTENDAQVRELYENVTANADSDTIRSLSFDAWYNSWVYTSERFEEPKPYEIVPTDVGVRVLADVSYDTYGRVFGSSLTYIDDGCIRYNGCTFIRIS